MKLTNNCLAIGASTIAVGAVLGFAPPAGAPSPDPEVTLSADTAIELGLVCVGCADMEKGEYTKEELRSMGPQPIPRHLLNSPDAVVAGGMGPGHEPDPLTVVLDFIDPGDPNSTDIIGNEVSTFDPTIFGFTAGDFDVVAQAVLQTVLDDYFAIPDSLSSGSPLPPGTDLACDIVIGDIGTPPSNGATEYYYIQIGEQVNGETYLGQAAVSSIRNAAGLPSGIANGSIVGTMFSNNIQGIGGLVPANALSSGNLEFTRHALGGTTGHEVGHAVSLRHVDKAGSVTPNGLPPLMGTGAIDLPNQDRISEREFSISGVNAEQGGAVKFYIQQLINALGLHQLETGACCLCDGTCLPDVTQAVCEATDGFRVWAEGATCFEADCEPVGACCLCTGLCIENTTQLECLVIPNADRWVECGECATLVPPCDPLGACCLCDGSCLDDVTEAVCNANGSSVSWSECTDCSAADCDPVGACCLCDGTCLENETEQKCSENPLFVSWNECTDCASLVPPCEETGACCLCDGTCIDDTTEADCVAMTDYRSWTACSDCATTTCEIVGACCLCTGECIENITQAECLANPEAFEWTECTLCVDLAPPCEPRGACCLCDGTCQDDLTLAECQALSPEYYSWTECTLCIDVECVPRGACCLCDGTCTDDTPEAECLANPLFFSFTLCTDCVNIVPPCEPTGACCLCDATCIDDLTEADCMANAMYSSWTECGKCADIVCAETGACCLGGAVCMDHLSELDCLDMDGYFQGVCTLCPAPGPDVTGDAGTKGSLLYFSKVDLRWDAAGFLTQDTFLSISNDWPTDLKVQMYFINGDEPIAAAGGERAHLGWNWFDVTLNLTGDQPTYWSAHSGLPAGVPPFTSLDPGFPPGRPAPDGGRMMRGYIVVWAVNAQNQEISWNHLSGVGTIVDYLGGSAWEYGAEAFAIVNGTALGMQTGTPGVLNLSGVEYAHAHDTLLLNFQASGASAFSGPLQVISDTSVTLHPLSVDLRQINDGPVTTKADYAVWNMNEVKLSGTHRCVTCWDQTLISAYDPPNNLLIQTLQTDHGKARIGGVAGPIQCDVGELVSGHHALSGVFARHLTFDGGAANATSGERLVGMGLECAQVKYDVLGFPLTYDPPSQPKQLLPWLERLFDLEAGSLDP